MIENDHTNTLMELDKKTPFLKFASRLQTPILLQVVPEFHKTRSEVSSRLTLYIRHDHFRIWK